MSSSEVSTSSEVLIAAQKLAKSIEEFQSIVTQCENFTTKVLKGSSSGSVSLSDKQFNKLVQKGREAKSAASKAEKACASCLDKISKMEAESPKKRKGKLGNHPNVGAKRFKGDSAFSIPKGRQVAAKISKDKDTPEEWILCSVVGYDDHKQIYEVEDEDPGDESDPEPYRRHYWLACHCLIPLPQEGEKVKEIPKGTTVLSMFPATTSFYRAVVELPPRGKKFPDYTIKFEDDDDETGATPPRKVKPRFVCLRENVAKS
eukprot:TRINITY_DN2416_c0_g1_i1.p1 TRINITY_DN2416_c0_g1~~TRINITY_DN2416_c0_g1_i1.p1  ORF type:complete len:260 (-),score=65.49 TRINITY_DN2416_c0_g1_i1:807-1586(-)